MRVKRADMTQSVDGNFGFDDVPAEDDLLSISSYVDGLVEFIDACPTPMTVAVQGNWGTGKTSAMLQIRKQLQAQKPDVKTIFFNTWQYSQFDLGENLAINMLKAIANGLEPSQAVQKTAKVENLKRLIFKAGRLYASKTVPAFMDLAGLGLVGKAVGAAVETAADMTDRTTQELDSVEILSSLRHAFAEAVEDSGRKLIVFVDDLDRLAPGRAIEVMEAIKVFLDVPKCVFVLAIDFEVVKLGVQEKYGETVSDRKARSFFDKIIQVPFHMPVARYDMTKLFTVGLARAKVETTQATFMQYMALSSASVGANPRSTKRLLNTFLLLKSILESEKKIPAKGTSKGPAENYLQLFSVLCLQTAFPEAYSALAENGGNGDPADELSVHGDSDGNEQFQRWGIPENELALVGRFFEELTSVFTVDSTFSNEAFNRAFSQSSITSVTSNDASPGRYMQTFDPAERRLRAIEKRPQELVDLALQFEREFTAKDDVFAAQTNPVDWTMRMAKGEPRIGLLTIRAKDLKVVLEFKTHKIDGEQLVLTVNAIKGAFNNAVGTPAELQLHRDVPQVDLRPAYRGGIVMEISKISTAAHVSQVVRALEDHHDLAAARM